ncbi:hypothetical protein ACFYZ9_23015 [Streptomyces sp. NPDC001691]|uniref:PH-like domain-containing protein n=1 Tax=unclassified Streptomyces TaxID=2593676 RepID=UPI000DEB5060|nr:hypothetical protein [Streptomyces sp. SDr-06]RCH67164.1 hypothetical protein DT019_19040 [Streptomyces sp. SDr-06]
MTYASLINLAAEEKSAEVTNWGGRIGWLVGLALFVALVYWLMRQGWQWRGRLQADLPDLPTRPSPTAAPGEGGEPPLPGMPEAPGEAKLRLSGRYHGSTTAGQWLDRIVAHGLGVRSKAELTLTDAGLDVVRPGANDFFVPAAQLREARLDKGIAGKVLTEGGLLVVTWSHGDRLIDSGFRSDRAEQHAAWVEAINSMIIHTTTTEGAAR